MEFVTGNANRGDHPRKEGLQKTFMEKVSEEKAPKGNGVCYKTTTNVKTKAAGEASSQVIMVVAVILMQFLVRLCSVVTYCEDS